MTSKKCKICLNTKDTIFFYNNKRNKDGKENKCKECVRQLNINNKDKIRESQLKWREKNPDYMKNYGKSDKSKEYHKEYYKEHKEDYIKRKQNWRKNNSEKDKEERKQYLENNREKINEYHSIWKKKKEKTMLFID
jgi:hypothetical protein